MEGTWDDDLDRPEATRRASNMLEMVPQSEEELLRIREAVFRREGLMVSLFDLLRRVPRRILMLFKMNDLTRYAVMFVPVSGRHSSDCLVSETWIWSSRRHTVDHAFSSSSPAFAAWQYGEMIANAS